MTSLEVANGVIDFLSANGIPKPSSKGAFSSCCIAGAAAQMVTEKDYLDSRIAILETYLLSRAIMREEMGKTT